MKKTCVAALLTLFTLAPQAQAEEITKPHTFATGQTINAAQFNENFDTLYGEVNILFNALKNPGSQHHDNGDGTVTDRLTGLIWLKNANCFGQQTWDAAMASAAALANGQCGLTDGSVAGAWRLPSFVELKRFHDFTWPVQSTSHPFSGVVGSGYWSGTSFADGTSRAWAVYLYYGLVGNLDETYTGFVWPVRGGQ